MACQSSKCIICILLFFFRYNRSEYVIWLIELTFPETVTVYNAHEKRHTYVLWSIAHTRIVYDYIYDKYICLNEIYSCYRFSEFLSVSVINVNIFITISMRIVIGGNCLLILQWVLERLRQSMCDVIKMLLVLGWKIFFSSAGIRTDISSKAAIVRQCNEALRMHPALDEDIRNRATLPHVISQYVYLGRR